MKKSKGCGYEVEFKSLLTINITGEVFSLFIPRSITYDLSCQKGYKIVEC